MKQIDMQRLSFMVYKALPRPIKEYTVHNAYYNGKKILGVDWPVFNRSGTPPWFCTEQAANRYIDQLLQQVKQFYSSEQVMRYLDISRWTLGQAEKAGKLWNVEFPKSTQLHPYKKLYPRAAIDQVAAASPYQNSDDSLAAAATLDVLRDAAAKARAEDWPYIQHEGQRFIVLKL